MVTARPRYRGALFFLLEQPVTVGRSGTPGLLTAICWLGWVFTTMIGA